MASKRVSLLVLMVKLLIAGISSTTFTLSNKCDYSVWPGILSNAGVPPLSTTGFVLQKGESKTIFAPISWGGRFWGRTLCSNESSSGEFYCVTGDCGSGEIECSGKGAAPPATLAEFTLDGHDGFDFFDVSLVDGYNLPMLVAPQGGSGKNCTSTGCVADINSACPSGLRVTDENGREGVACKSACQALGQPQYCCSGAYNTPDTCKPSSYSQFFKKACPRAYSYAYDDKSSIFSCVAADYVITFCASSNVSLKSSEKGENSATNSPIGSSTMVYEGAALYQSNAQLSMCSNVAGRTAVVILVSIMMGIGRPPTGNVNGYGISTFLLIRHTSINHFPYLKWGQLGWEFS